MAVGTEKSQDSASPIPPGAQTLVQQFLDFLNSQNALLNGAGAALHGRLPLPEGGRLAGLHQEFAAQHAKLWSTMVQTHANEPAPIVVQPDAGDRRFAAPEWSATRYFDYLRQAYLINARFLTELADAIPIMDGRAKSRVQFLTRQYVDAMAPSNFAAFNPEFIKTALETKGASITLGIQNMLADMRKGRISMTDDEAFEVGGNLAVTPGAVVFENELLQLIQYVPTTPTVAERPLLIVPPCINKFYILDLQPDNSFVKHAIDKGVTVFLISWRNVKAAQGTLTWDDYVQTGVFAALDVVREITGVAKPNVLGFCVGGTILSSALGVLAGRGEDPVSSLTLMTTLLDYSDAGELGCFIDETSVAAREATLGKGGLLPGRELANVFSSLRANDLIWQYVVGNYLKGGKPRAFDLLYWNSDSTNLPGPFLAYYLRHMYLQNELRVPGKLEMLGVNVDLNKVKVPAYLLATREDHIVPWQAAFLSRQILGGPCTFVLGASGHIAGAINPASKNRRSYWTNEAPSSSAEEWLSSATEQRGSWWTHWIQWLGQFGGEPVPARTALGSTKHPIIEPAPGRYVKEAA